MGMKNLGNEEDVRRTQKANDSGFNFIKLDSHINFVAVVSGDYEDGFLHYLRKIVNKKKITKAIPCKAGLDGHGFAPEDCPRCRKSLDAFEAGKVALSKGDKGEAKVFKEDGNNLRASYKMYMYGLKGDTLSSRDSNGKKTVKPDFADAVDVGILGLTEKQKKLLLGIIDDPDYPEIKKGSDLVGKILRIDREKDGNKKTISIKPVGKIRLADVNVKDLPSLEPLLALPEDYDLEIENFFSEEPEEEVSEPGNDEKGGDPAPAGGGAPDNDEMPVGGGKKKSTPASGGGRRRTAPRSGRRTGGKKK